MSDNKRLAEERIATFDGEISRKSNNRGQDCGTQVREGIAVYQDQQIKFLQRIRNKM